MRDKAKALIENVLAPLVAADGGRLEFLRIDGKRVQVRMTGTCLGCPGKPYTVARILEPALRRVLGDDITVDAESDPV